MSDELLTESEKQQIAVNAVEAWDKERASSFAAPAGSAAVNELEILCEVLRNITNGTTHLRESNFDHAALDLEVAAGKLRGLERARQQNS